MVRRDPFKLVSSLTSYTDGLSVSHLLDSIKVVDVTGQSAQTAGYRLVDVDLDVQTYRLHGTQTPNQAGKLDEAEDDKDDVKDEASLPQARVMPLPNRDLDGIWDSYFLCRRTYHSQILIQSVG